MSHSTGTPAPAQPSLRTPLGRVRGTGSAKSGVHHWWMMRVTSIALLPLTIWFTVTLATNAGMTQAEAAWWIGRPVNAVLLLALIGLTFHHIASGLQVILEDYANQIWVRTGLILAVKFGCALFALAGAVAVLRLAVLAP